MQKKKKRLRLYAELLRGSRPNLMDELVMIVAVSCLTAIITTMILILAD